MVWEAIDGETPIDLSDLKDRSIRTRSQLNQAEAENVRLAYQRYFTRRVTTKRAPFDLTWTKRLHEEMFGNVMISAGQSRKQDLNFGVKWTLIDQRLHSMLKNLEEWTRSAMPLVEQSVRLHYEAVVIHPFLNGNGRWSRMLANLWLRRQSHAMVMWPEETIGTTSPIRGEYLSALKSADQGEFETLIELHTRYLSSS